MIEFACSHCGTRLKVKDEAAGRACKCPSCRRTVVVPAGPGTVALFAPTARVGGPASTLGRAGADPGVTLPPAPVASPEGHKPVAEVLAGRVGAGGRYVLAGEIARGGMGAVVRGIDCDIRREVAVKFMLDAEDPRKKVRFVEEAQITGQLEHPNIVPVHELGVDDQNRVFFAMKMVRGRSLAQVLDELAADPKAGQTWSLGRLLGVLVNVCHALAYAHSRGVIHRDLKPANIMVGDFGEVYVMDWGLAKVLADGKGGRRPDGAPAAAPPRQVVTARQAAGDVTQDGAVLGTPAYMPPEQADGRIEALDQRSDIYALGAILYALLTLQPPVETDGDPVAVLVRVVQGEIRSPEERAPERARRGQIPLELSAIARKALALRPADRYPTVEAFRRDLERFLEGRSVSAKPDTAWETFRKLVRRNKGASVATAVALLVLAAVVGVAFVVNYRARVRAEQSYAAYRQEEEEKIVRTKKAAPAFVRAARLSADRRLFADALTQVDVALEWDPDLAEAYLLRGQLLIALDRYPEAAAALQEYARRNPDDAGARRLLELAGRPEPGKAGFFQQLRQVFEEQKADALVEVMSRRAEALVGTFQERVREYQKRLEAIWGPVTAKQLKHENGELKLLLQPQRDRLVKDLTPLKGIPLTHLGLGGFKIDDLKPLQNMPLGSLTLGNTPVTDLRPLREMRLTFLDLSWTPVEDLEPLRDMPLKRLLLRSCTKLENLGPLRHLPSLTDLELMDCFRVEDLRPLQSVPLEALHLGNCHKVRSLEPLRGKPLKKLHLAGHEDLADFTPLKDMALTELWIGGCRAFKDLQVLQGLHLTGLEVSRCPVKRLAPLKGMKLTWAHLDNLGPVEDFHVLEWMPLTDLNLAYSPRLSDLTFLRHLKRLRTLDLTGCPGVKDLGPLAGLELRSIALSPRHVEKGVEALRDMKSLQTIFVEGGVKYDSREEFSKDFQAGKFRR